MLVPKLFEIATKQQLSPEHAGDFPAVKAALENFSTKSELDANLADLRVGDNEKLVMIRKRTSLEN